MNSLELKTRKPVRSELSLILSDTLNLELKGQYWLRSFPFHHNINGSNHVK